MPLQVEPGDSCPGAIQQSQKSPLGAGKRGGGGVCLQRGEKPYGVVEQVGLGDFDASQFLARHGVSG